MRTTAPRPPLLEQALGELAVCLVSLREAEEMLRAQNGVLKEYGLARRAERRRLDLFRCVSDALLVTDAGGLILESNPAAARLLSGSKCLRAGRPVANFFTHDRRSALLGVLRAVECGAGWEGGLWIKPRRGLAFPASVTVSYMPGIGKMPPALHWLLRPHIPEF